MLFFCFVVQSIESMATLSSKATKLRDTLKNSNRFIVYFKMEGMPLNKPGN